MKKYKKGYLGTFVVAVLILLSSMLLKLRPRKLEIRETRSWLNGEIPKNLV
jgi:hypothetical protein